MGVTIMLHGFVIVTYISHILVIPRRLIQYRTALALREDFRDVRIFSEMDAGVSNGFCKSNSSMVDSALATALESLGSAAPQVIPLPHLCTDDLLTPVR